MKKTLADIKKQAEESKLGKTLEEWDAIKKAERKTFSGKVKYVWEHFIYYPIYRFFDKIKNIPDEIKYFLQRGKRGFSDRDAWSIDYYLSSWMPKALRTMKKGWGYPGLGRVNTHQKWSVILEKMAKGFDASRKIGEYKYRSTTQLKKLQAVQKEGLKLFIKYFDNLWD